MTDSIPDPCPFCAHHHVLILENVEDEFFAECNNCSACGPVTSTYQRAEALWNFRADKQLH